MFFIPVFIICYLRFTLILYTSMLLVSYLVNDKLKNVLNSELSTVE